MAEGSVFKAIGLVIVGGIVLLGLLAMGPLGWAVFGTMLAVGAIEVARRRRGGTATDEVRFCPNCGTAVDRTRFDDQDTTEEAEAWTVAYCHACGAPLPDEPADEPRPPNNCPSCGAPNEPDAGVCGYCGEALA